ncbi:unnamed protein product [Arctia plantaginis]|nr:unnamed protein product [Arctia plantaginis]
MRALILVVGDKKKETSSTGGMAVSVKTSELMRHRVEYCVPQRTELIVDAIKNKDFPKFAEITMKDSNQFHAICLDSYPPFVYMNDISHSIVGLIHKYNEISGKVKVAYTFDAGSNACLYLLEEDVSEVISLIKHVYPPSNSKGFVTGLSYVEDVNSKILKMFQPKDKDLIKYVIYTKVGDGPSEVTDGSHLLNRDGSLIHLM